MWVAFASTSAKATHIFFSKNVSVYAIFDDQTFNDTLTNDIVSFEQQDPALYENRTDKPKRNCNRNATLEWS